MTIMCLDKRPDELRAKVIGSVLIVWHDVNRNGLIDPMTDQVWTGAPSEEIRAIGSVGKWDGSRIAWGGYSAPTSGNAAPASDPRVAIIEAKWPGLLDKLAG